MKLIYTKEMLSAIEELRIASERVVDAMVSSDAVEQNFEKDFREVVFVHCEEQGLSYYKRKISEA